MYKVRDLCNDIPLVDLNVDPWPEGFVHRMYAGLFRLVALPIYGDDIRDTIPLPSMDAYTRLVVGVGGSLKVRQAKILKYPETFPDPEGEFYGYDRRATYSLEGFSADGTKDLINVAYSIIRGRLVMLEGRYLTGKSETFNLYRACFRDEWTEFVDEVWKKCRLEWEYRIPPREQDRQRLKALCTRMLDFENFNLSIYRDFMLRELRPQEINWPYSDSDYMTYSLSRFEMVAYPNDETMISALKPYLTSDNVSWQEAACEAMEKIGTVSPT